MAPKFFRKMFFALKPKSWKSDPQLDRKKVNRYEVNPKAAKNGLATTQPFSKSSDWTEVDLEVPEKEAIHLKNPQLSFIFSDNSTPTPPPRKHKKTLREKIETVAKNSINALQSKKVEGAQKLEDEEKVLAEEPVCVKKIIRHGCPACDDRETCSHKEIKRDVSKTVEKTAEREKRKSMSVVSLPNYNELKLSLSNPGDDLKYIDASVTNSANSLPNGEQKRLSTASASTGRFENYMTRCRSFGSLLNNKLKSTQKTSGNESDDSLGILEDWDLGILEHYNPKDASLPRPRKPIPDSHIISDIEKLIVPDEEIEPPPPPVRPLRRSESLVRRVSQEATETAIKSTPEPVENEQNANEHSSLMRILQEYAVKDVQVVPGTTGWCKTPSVAKMNEDFINAEKVAVS